MVSNRKQKDGYGDAIVRTWSREVLMDTGKREEHKVGLRPDLEKAAERLRSLSMSGHHHNYIEDDELVKAIRFASTYFPDGEEFRPPSGTTHHQEIVEEQGM